jgi:hydroxymethylpyrimidine pyrophosphatase-like HAD family hydrolase
MRDHRSATAPGPAFPIRLIALDIDGTLVGHDLQIPERTAAALREAVRRGVRVSLATGRMTSSAMAFVNQLGLRAPVIGHQGAVIRAMPRHRELARPIGPGSRGRVGPLLHHQPLAADVVRDAVLWCRAQGMDPHINDLERMVIWSGDPSFEDYSSYVGRDALVVPDLGDAIRRPMSKVIAVGEAGQPMALVEEARRVFAGRADPTVSHPRFLEFVAPGVS